MPKTKTLIQSATGALLVALAQSSLAFAPCTELQVISSSVRLLSEPDEYYFYYRIELGEDLAGGPQYTVYIPPEVAISYIYDNNGFRSIPQGLERENWSDLLPLQRHTDIYLPLLNVAGRPKRRMLFLIADAIEEGNAAIWGSGGYLDEIVVEHYDEGCERGRIFRNSRGIEILRIVDSIA